MRKSSLPILSGLILFGALVAPRPSIGMSSLHALIRDSRTDEALSLIKRQSSRHLNAQDKVGNTLLTSATIRGNIPVVRALLESGANVNLTDHWGVSPLIIAASHGNKELTELFIDAGAQIEHRDLSGKPALLHAISKGHQEILNFWVQIKAPICDVTDYSGNTVLMIAAETNRIEIVTQLIQMGCPLNARNSSGETALLKAALKNHQPIITELLEAGADPSLQDSQGKSFVTLSKSIRLSTVQLFLRKLSETGHIEYAITLLKIYPFLNPRSPTPNYLNLQKEIELTLEKRLPHLIQNEISLKNLRELRLSLAETKIPIRPEIHAQLTQRLKLAFLPTLEDRISLFETILAPKREVNIQDSDPSAQNDPLCGVCLTPLTPEEWQPHQGPANCNCPVHEDCAKSFAQFLINNSGTDSALCALGCGGQVQASFLRRLGVSEDQVSQFLINQLSQRISHLRGWVFCPTPDCLNGALNFTHKARTFQCEICGVDKCLLCGTKHYDHRCTNRLEDESRSVELLKRLLEEGAQPGGRYRPCYHCGIMTERVEGCNAMKCGNPQCGKKWHWNNGTEGPHDGIVAPMNYKPRVKAHF